jgi:SulP family sulfate permease
MAHAFHPERLLTNLSAVLIVGIDALIFSISLASLIFAGELSPFASAGIVLTLLGTMIIGFTVAVFSSLPEAIAGPQEVPAVILALIAASISKAMAATAVPEEIFLTVVAAIALTSLLTGLVFFALGHFKWGNLVRFLPYPVMGGFLAGTGWLLVAGAVTVMTDVAVGFSSLPVLFQAGMWLRWLPALVFAVLLLLVLDRCTHFMALPTMIMAGVGLFYTAMWMTGASMPEIAAGGWLLDPPEHTKSYSFSLSDLSRVNWQIIFEHFGEIAILTVISVVGFLLNASGLELVFRKDMDLNRELQVVGIGNMVCGFAGGMVGFHLLSNTTLSRKIERNDLN